MASAPWETHAPAFEIAVPARNEPFRLAVLCDKAATKCGFKFFSGPLVRAAVEPLRPAGPAPLPAASTT